MLLEDDGYIMVEVQTRDEETGEQLVSEVSLDLYEAFNTCLDIQVKHQGKPIHEFHRAIAEQMTRWGFPSCSDRLADKFVSHVVSLVSDLKKKDGVSENANSADSTDSRSFVNGQEMISPEGSPVA